MCGPQLRINLDPGPRFPGQIVVLLGPHDRQSMEDGVLAFATVSRSDITGTGPTAGCGHATDADGARNQGTRLRPRHDLPILIEPAEEIRELNHCIGGKASLTSSWRFAVLDVLRVLDYG